MSVARERCPVEGCENPPGKTLGRMCWAHYTRLRRHGDVHFTTRLPPGLSVRERLEWHGWEEVKGPLDTPCWEWRGSKGSNGYGQLNVNGVPERTHRLAYEAWVGPIPEGLLIRHKCDNRPCINPGHLEPGTHLDNNRDREERHGFANAKLTWGDVDEIRERYAQGGITYLSLGREYGVSETSIGYIVKNKTWVRKEENA